VLRIGQEIARGLAAAHQRGLLHRDIKPANIWLEALSGEPGASATGGCRVKILDFGLAQTVGGKPGLSWPGIAAGTPAYMSP
jgi:serine/threonine protein kinase